MITSSGTPSPLNELEIVQNPALGAYIIWRFGIGFQEEEGLPPTVPHAFLVLPLVLHQSTCETIRSTQKGSGLTLFAAKLGENRENLLAVHERALALRRLTMQSIVMRISGSLLTLDYVAATIRANSPGGTVRKPMLPERIKHLPGAAEKVGYWFSKIDLHQVVSTLAVAL
jgi:hypothetical protein